VNEMTIEALHSALRGLSARQRVIADNVANSETPGFLAGKVSFEDALRRAVDDGDRSEIATVAPEVSRSLAATNLNGNNVNLDSETVAMVDTGLRYELAVSAVNNEFRILRTSIGQP